MKYAIPSPAKEIMNQMAPILLGICSAEQIILGGGTALAARWNHRRSTDIDLFMNYKDFESIRDSLESDLAKASGVLDWRSSKMWCRGSFAEGDFSIFSTSPLLLAERSKNLDFTEPWGFPLESIEEILAKKLRLRMYGNGEFYARDFYDIVTANEEKPPALSRALSILEKDQRVDIVKELYYWRRRPLSGRPLEEVHHPEWLPDLVSRTSTIIENGPSFVPEPDPPPPSPSFDPF